MRRPAPFNVILITDRFARAAALTPSICRALLAAKLPELSLAQRFMQFALRLVFFPQPRSIDADKPRPLLVPLCFPPLLVLTGYESAEASFQRCLRQLAINRARFHANQRPAIRKDEAVGAQIKPDTVSVSDPVKLLPTCRVNESLGMSLKPCLE